LPYHRFFNFKFNCECEACTKDYPTMFSLPQTKTPTKLSLSFQDYYQLMNPKKAFKLLEDCKEYLQKNDCDYPSETYRETLIVMRHAFSTLCLNCGLDVNLR
jgi:hypothetical protein